MTPEEAQAIMDKCDEYTRIDRDSAILDGCYTREQVEAILTLMKAKAQ